MYNDLTLNVFALEDFVREDGNLYLKRDVELEQAKTHVFLRTRKGLLEMTPQFFKIYKGSITKVAQSESRP